MSNGNRSSRKPAKAFAIIKSPGKDSAYDVQYIEVGPVWQMACLAVGKVLQVLKTVIWRK